MITPARQNIRRDTRLIGLIGLLVGLLIALYLPQPGYTDAYYYYNAGARLVNGQGLTDAALWTYLGSPAGLPAPSHLYWMPMPSLLAALSMKVFGISFHGAQPIFVALYALAAVLAYLAGWQIAHQRSVAWFAALITLGGGYSLAFWFTTSSFGPFGLFGGGALFCVGMARRRADRPITWRWYAAAGALSGLAHLTRADGLLMLFVLLIVALWPGRGRSRRGALIGVAAYLLIMGGWFARNLSVSGAIFPAGGLETAWMRTYDEIVNYPPGISAEAFLRSGLANILGSRGIAFGANVMTFIAVEGLILFAPFILIAAIRHRRDPLVGGVLIYAVALHLAMTFVFPYPGVRGGLLHSSAALVPFWAALGAEGLLKSVQWLAPRRRWPVRQATTFFRNAALLWVFVLSAVILQGRAASWGAPLYPGLELPPDAVAVSNDPPALYYATGIGGVPLPNAPPDTLRDLAAKYGVTHVIVDRNRTAPMDDLWTGKAIPPFLERVRIDDLYRVYRIVSP